jgi:hypothetical protein
MELYLLKRNANNQGHVIAAEFFALLGVSAFLREQI